MLTNPFPGLRPFGPEDHAYFCGRGREIAAVLELLREHRLAVVTGESGCGKSSLIHAGVIPTLPAAARTWGGPTPAAWHGFTVRPGSDPLRNLAETLVQGGSPLGEKAPGKRESLPEAPVETARRSLEGDESALHYMLCEQIPREKGVVMFVDQFEELFRHLRDPGTYAAGGPDALYLPQHRQAHSFVANLLRLREQRPGALLVITARAEFLGLVSSIIGLPEQLAAALYLCPRLEEHDLEKCIHLPAERAGLRVRQETLGPLLAHYSGDNEGLPRLQHFVHRRAWAALHPRNHKSPGVLDLAPESDGPCLSAQQGEAGAEEPSRPVGTYREALDRDLDAVFGKLAPRQQAVAEALFRALCYWNDRGTLLRRTVEVSDLLGLSGQDMPVVVSTLERLEAQGFIATSGVKEILPTDDIEAQHECILRCWRRLSASEGSPSPNTGLRQILRSVLEWLGLGSARHALGHLNWGADEQFRRRIFSQLHCDAINHRNGLAGVWRGRDQMLAMHCFGTSARPRINATWASLHSPSGRPDAAAVVLRFIQEGAEWRQTVHCFILGIVFFLLLAVGFAVFQNKAIFEARNAAEKALIRAKTEETAKTEALQKAIEQADIATAEQEKWTKLAQELADSKETDPARLQKALEGVTREQKKKTDALAAGKKAIESLNSRLAEQAQERERIEKEYRATATQLAGVATRHRIVDTENLLGYLQNEAEIGSKAMHGLRTRYENDPGRQEADPQVDPLADAACRLWEIQFRLASPDPAPKAAVPGEAPPEDPNVAAYEKLWKEAFLAQAIDSQRWTPLTLRIGRHFAEYHLQRARTGQQSAGSGEAPAALPIAQQLSRELDPTLQEGSPGWEHCRAAAVIIDRALSVVPEQAAAALEWAQRVDRGWLLLDKALAHTLLDPPAEAASAARPAPGELGQSPPGTPALPAASSEAAAALAELGIFLAECAALPPAEKDSSAEATHFRLECQRLAASRTLVEGHLAFKSACQRLLAGRPYPQLAEKLREASAAYSQALEDRAAVRTTLGSRSYVIGGSVVTSASMLNEESSVHWFRLPPLDATVRWACDPQVKGRPTLDEKWVEDAIGVAQERLDSLWRLRKEHPLDFRRTDSGALQCSAMLLQTSRMLGAVRLHAASREGAAQRKTLLVRDRDWCTKLRFMSVDVLAVKLEAEPFTVIPPERASSPEASPAAPTLSVAARDCEENLRRVFLTTDAATARGSDLWGEAEYRKDTIEFMQKRVLPIVKAARLRMSELEKAWKRIEPIQE